MTQLTETEIRAIAKDTEIAVTLYTLVEAKLRQRVRIELGLQEGDPVPPELQQQLPIITRELVNAILSGGYLNK